MSGMSKKTPAEKVYDAFGGPMEVSRETGITTSEVYRWNYDKDKSGTGGLVPHQHQELILRTAKKLFLKLKPEDLVKVP